MTFCLGMKTKDGLIGIADTRVTSGTERITARKVTLHQHGKHSMFLMTSGLRSVRDKALTYFEDVLETDDVCTHMYQAANAFARQIRRVAKEDEEAIAASNLSFNLHALVGGQLEEDKEHKLYMIYPQGNWVEVSQATPFYIIGESGYGKPILERSIQYDSNFDYALKAGFLAFNATITCAVDVDYPIDVVLYRRDTFEIVMQRYEKDELEGISKLWQESIQNSVNKLPSDWTGKILSQLPPSSQKESLEVK